MASIQTVSKITYGTMPLTRGLRPLKLLKDGWKNAARTPLLRSRIHSF